MRNIKDFSTNVAVKFSERTGNANAALDPAQVLAIIEIVAEIIARFKECRKTPEQALKSASSPSIWERIIIRNTVKNQVGRKAFREHGDELISSLLISGKNVKADEIRAMYDEVDND